MATQNCSGQFPFICFRDNLVLVKENKTWEEALEHCRALKSPYYASTLYDLISVQPGEDHNYMINKIKEANTEMVGSYMVTHERNVDRRSVLQVLCVKVGHAQQQTSHLHRLLVCGANLEGNPKTGRGFSFSRANLV